MRHRLVIEIDLDKMPPVGMSRPEDVDDTLGKVAFVGTGTEGSVQDMEGNVVGTWEFPEVDDSDRGLFRWLAQTYHQAYHEGPGTFEECPKSSCDVVARRLGSKP